MRIAFDSGAIIALVRGDRDFAAIVKRLWEKGAFFVLPAPVLTETLRGTKADAAVFHAVRRMQTVDLSARVARLAGELLGRARSTATVDAMIVALAVDDGVDRILTTDPVDITRLADGELEVQAI